MALMWAKQIPFLFWAQVLGYLQTRRFLPLPITPNPSEPNAIENQTIGKFLWISPLYCSSSTLHFLFYFLIIDRYILVNFHDEG
jgi:hypothetical protein